MDFLKKHYEKIILVLVLLILTAAVGALLLYIPGEKKHLEDTANAQINSRPQPLPALDTTNVDQALKRLDDTVRVDLTSKHRVFNPMLWQLRSDVRIVKIGAANQYGIDAVKLTNVSDIYLTVTYVTNTVNGYQIKVRDESAAQPADRSVVVHPDSTADAFFLRKVEGPAENPTALLLEFKNTHEQYTLKGNPGEPFRKVVAHSADLGYPPEPALHWNKMRAAALGIPAIRSSFTLDGLVYKVIDVQSNNVVISEPNQKRHTIFLSRTLE